MKKKHKVLIFIASVIAVAFVSFMISYIVVNGNNRQYQNHLDKAQQYMDDLQYEQAIAELKMAIEIEEKDERAYNKIEDIYEEQKKYDEANEALKQEINAAKKDDMVSVDNRSDNISGESNNDDLISIKNKTNSENKKTDTVKNSDDMVSIDNTDNATEQSSENNTSTQNTETNDDMVSIDNSVQPAPEPTPDTSGDDMVSISLD